MKTFKTIISLAALSLVVIASCKKAEQFETAPQNPPTAGGGNPTYSSLADFYNQNGVPMQTFTINGTTGGSFTTPQGTIVFVPSNAFETQTGAPVTGNVTIVFKDIYKKSDMLFSDMPTTMLGGAPLKSAGEFFIKASQSGSALVLAPGKKIDVTQPLLAGPIDTAMDAFVNVDDTLGSGWVIEPGDSIYYNASNYVFSLYSFSSPLDSGTWCNSDNPSAFSSYPQTTLTLHANTDPNYDPAVNPTDVFLVFQNMNTMIHVYAGTGNDFPYYYAPQGLACTVVAVGVKNGNLYSSFTTIPAIGSNQTVNFSMSQTTSNDFKAQLDLLN